MKQPAYLHPGDTIGLVATARFVKPTEIAFAINTLQNCGYQTLLAPHLFEENHQFAGTDEQRAGDLHELLINPDIKAILCVRGGYGSIRTISALPKYDYTQSKWLIGFSDITVIHGWLQQTLRWKSIHGPMAFSFASSKTTEKSILALLATLQGDLQKIEAPFEEFNRPGESNAQLVGGNLSVIYSTMGTPYEIQTEGKILFIEDLDEYLYHIDRMLMNLKLAGKLKNLAGLVVGGMTDMNDNQIPFGKSAKESIYYHTKEYNYPVAYDIPCGHLKNNMPLIMGHSYTLTVNNKGSILTPA